MSYESMDQALFNASATEYLNNEETTSTVSNTMRWKGRTEKSFTDEEIIQLASCYSTPNGLSTTDHPYLGSNQSVIRFAEDALVYTPTEALVLHIVAEHTSIPVPKVRRILKVEQRGLYLGVMDFIRARLCGGNMSADEKEQRIRSAAASGGCSPPENSPGTLGTFATQQDLVDRMNELTVLAGRVEEVGRFDASKLLVLTHNDLNGRNMRNVRTSGFG